MKLLVARCGFAGVLFAFLSLAAAAHAAEPAVKSVAVLPLKAKNKASKDVSSVLDDLLLAAVQKHAAGIRVVGQGDVDAALGFEKTKQVVGCDALSCAAEIAGALGVDSIIYGSFSRLGKKYVLSLGWIDQRTTNSLGRASEAIGAEEDQLDAGVNMVVATLFGAPSTPVATPTAAKPSAKAIDPMDLASWDQLSGTWYAKDGAIYGVGGHLGFKEMLTDYAFSATAELVSGPSTIVAWVSRFTHPQSSVAKPAGSADQGYGVNVAFGEAKVNVFRGVNNAWYGANPAWGNNWQSIQGIQPKTNRCTVEAAGPQHKMSCNGKLIYEFIDGTNPRGVVGLWVQSPQTVVRFTDIKLERR